MTTDSQEEAATSADNADKPEREKTEKEELEELAALFQQELNKAKEQAEQNGSISDWDNLATVNRTVEGVETVKDAENEEVKAEEVSQADEESAEEIDESLCIRCGKNERKTDENGEYISDYCEECEKARLKTQNRRLPPGNLLLRRGMPSRPFAQCLPGLNLCFCL